MGGGGGTLFHVILDDVVMPSLSLELPCLFCKGVRAGPSGAKPWCSWARGLGNQQMKKTIIIFASQLCVLREDLHTRYVGTGLGVVGPRNVRRIFFCRGFAHPQAGEI